MTNTSTLGAASGSEPADSDGSSQASRRISVSLTGRAAEATRRLGTRLELSEGEVIRRALSLFSSVVAEEEAGGTLVFKTKDGEYERVRWMAPL
jgi:hypothetical protein